MPFSFRTALVLAGFSASTLAMTGAPGLAIVPDKIMLPVVDTGVVGVNGSAAENVPPVSSPPASTGPTTAPDPDAPDFSSLAAAVAAQPLPETVDDDLACMAAMIYFEAKGEPLAGQLAVAQVVVNRTRSGRFPKSICSVVMQPGQFSFVRGGHLPIVDHASAAYRKAAAVARVAMGKLWESDAGDALFFHAAHVTPGWRMTRVAAIGHHVFYR